MDFQAQFHPETWNILRIVVFPPDPSRRRQGRMCSTFYGKAAWKFSIKSTGIPGLGSSWQLPGNPQTQQDGAAPWIQSTGMLLLEAQQGRMLQNSQLEAPPWNSCSGDGAAARGPKGGGREFVPKIWERAKTLLDLLLLMSQGEEGAAPGGSAKGNHSIPSLWNLPGTGWESPSRVWDPCRIQGWLQQFQQQLFHLPRAPGNLPAVSLGSTTAHAPPSFLPFPTAPGFSQDAPATPGGFGSLFPSPGKWGSCGAAQNSTLYLFPGVLPSPGSVCSSPERIKALPRRLGADGSSQRIPPFSSLSPTLKFPRWDQKIQRDQKIQFFLMLKIREQKLKSRDIQTENFQDSSGIVP